MFFAHVLFTIMVAPLISNLIKRLFFDFNYKKRDKKLYCIGKKWCDKQMIMNG